MSDDAPLIEMHTPWRRNVDELGPALERWARTKVAPDAEVASASSPGQGYSSETALFEMRVGGTTERYAARLAPMPDVYPVFPKYDIEVQARCMRVVREHTDVPVPTVHWVELDAQWLGTPFLVMNRIDGAAPADVPPYNMEGWVLDATPEQRNLLEQACVAVLARLHTITPATADLSFLEHPEHGATALAQHLGRERAYYEWARDGAHYPLIERTFAWLDANRPEEGETVLNWGDSRLGNIMFRDFRPVAALDWEMAALGPREIDLAWMIFLHRFFADLTEQFGMPGIPGFMAPERIAAMYEAASGHEVRDLHWHEVFGALRFAIVSVRTGTRNVAYGLSEPPADPDDFIMFRRLLDDMIS
jgi:aminoglycoside phosphotransferase (APT) family kinase protein